MSVGQAYSAAIIGIDGVVVRAQVDATRGLPGVHVVGTVDVTVRESRDRVRSAITNSDLPWPRTRTIIALSPATIPKSGSGFDLAIALAVLLAQCPTEPPETEQICYLGELDLDGTVQPVPGVLPRVRAARDAGLSTIVVAADNAAEARLIEGVTVHPVTTLAEAWRGTITGQWPHGGNRDGAGLEGSGSRGQDSGAVVARSAGGGGASTRVSSQPPNIPDLADVRGQAEARYALEVAAAGGHSVLLLGPPGVGKSLLASCLPTLLPDLDEETALTTTAIHSVPGRVDPDRPLLTRPPFEAPHYRTTGAALLGGGSGHPRPGVLSRAHGGVLFLDEATEIAPSVVDSLRVPLETGSVSLARSAHPVTFPSQVQLVLAANPCRCGTADPRDCRCSPGTRQRHRDRLSGPLLDRVDVRVWVAPVSAADLAGPPGESSESVRHRVARARQRAAAFTEQSGGLRSGSVPSGFPDEFLRSATDPEVLQLVYSVVDIGELSARGATRVLRMAWTVFFLDSAAETRGPGPEHVITALRLRGVGDARWGYWTA